MICVSLRQESPQRQTCSFYENGAGSIFRISFADSRVEYEKTAGQQMLPRRMKKSANGDPNDSLGVQALRKRCVHNLVDPARMKAGSHPALDLEEETLLHFHHAHSSGRGCGRKER